jgi:hypothetical protein
MPLWHMTLAWQLQAVIREGMQKGLEKLVLSGPDCLMTFCVPLLLMRMGRGCANSAGQFYFIF